MRLIKVRPLVVPALLGLCIATSCDPETIAPLPTPNSPDSDKIIMSSLTVADDDRGDALVAMVGLGGAVEGAGEVDLRNLRTAERRAADSAVDGSFSTALFARAGDTFEVRFVSSDGVESTPVTVVVGQYDDERQEAPGGTALSSVPGSAGDDFAYEKHEADGGNEPPPCENPEDPESCPPGPPVAVDCEEWGCPAGADPYDRARNAETAQVAVILYWSASGALHFDAVGGTFTAGSNVIFMNHTSGAILILKAGTDGSLRFTLDAKPGDHLLVFSQSTEDPSATTPAVELTVPAKQ